MFVVMRIEKFEFKSSLPIPIKVDTQMVGYLPIYETREDALVDYPGAELAEIRFKEKAREANQAGGE